MYWSNLHDEFWAISISVYNYMEFWAIWKEGGGIADRSKSSYFLPPESSPVNTPMNISSLQLAPLYTSQSESQLRK